MQPAAVRRSRLDRSSVARASACPHPIYGTQTDDRAWSRFPVNISCFASANGLVSFFDTTTTCRNNHTFEQQKMSVRFRKHIEMHDAAGIENGMEAGTDYDPNYGKVDAKPYEWPHDGPLNEKTTALIVVDMQNDCK